MKRIFIVTSLFLVSLTSVVVAQEDVKTKHIRQLMVVMGSDKLGTQVMSTMISSFKKNYPNVDAAFWDEFQKEAKTDELINMMVPVYAKHFTDQDIQQLIAFYSTPIGKKYVENQPEIMQESFQIGMQWGQKIGERVQQKLKQKGYLKNS